MNANILGPCLECGKSVTASEERYNISYIPKKGPSGLAGWFHGKCYFEKLGEQYIAQKHLSILKKVKE